MDNDIQKQFESLEKRIKELESKQKSNQQMFGRSYTQAGNTNSDFLIKTRGQIKIQYGSKFIDLIKDGKINVDSKFIYKQNEVGTKDGIYVVGEKVTLVAGGTPIDIIGEVGTTYVSFLAPQETESDQKHTALVNIGLLAETQNDINITSGIVYVESEGKLYLVNNGNIEEFKVNFPNPFTEQFIISKNDSNIGSLLIKGKGKENAIAFDGLYIYSDSNSIINSDNAIDFYVGNSKKLNIDSFRTTFYNPILVSNIKSLDLTNDKGFSLQGGDNSTLEINNITVRNSEEEIPIIIGDLSGIDQEAKGIYTNNLFLKDLGNLNEIIQNINNKIDNLIQRVEDLENKQII